ncbi:MAG: hypothetical protein R6W75_00310 [Smithellaceae bacterium]
MELQRFLHANPEVSAPVSVDVPLISNQDVLMNVSLIKEYHENMSKKNAFQLVMNGLQRLGMAHIAYKRNPALTAEERFCAMLLRSAMVKDARLVIDRPFKLIPHLENAAFIFQALQKIDDLFVHCHIYDYRWMKEKYGDLCL